MFNLWVYFCGSISNTALVLIGIRKADVTEKGSQESDLLFALVVKP